MALNRPPRIGIGGPVGSGKTMLCLKLCQRLRERLSMAVVTNDIYCSEDAQFLIRHSALPAERIAGVETGGCPHTAIRDDTTMNEQAAQALESRFPISACCSSRAGATISRPRSPRNSSTRSSTSSTSPKGTRSRARAAPRSGSAICSSSIKSISRRSWGRILA